MPQQFLHGVETVEIDDGLRPIATVKSSMIGLVGTAPLAQADTFPVNAPVLVTGPRMAAGLGADGTLLDAYNAAYAQGVSALIVVRVTEGQTEAETLAAVTGSAAAGTGIHALMAAQNLTGQTPKILAAPGFTAPAAVAAIPGPVSALQAVAGRLRAVAVIDGPNTTEADAISYAGLFGSDRVYMVDPAVRVFDVATATYVTRPASGFVAGVISRMDATRGFWWSPSNQNIEGIAGTARPVTWALSEAETEANRMNEAKIASIVRANGFRLWGNRSLASDPLWAFLPVRRTADMVYESVEAAQLWAMDRPFSAQLIRDVRDSVQEYLNTLTARGAILGGKVWLDPELNTEATLKAGQLYLDFDIEPPAPLERLSFRAHREGAYYTELVTSVTADQ